MRLQQGQTVRVRALGLCRVLVPRTPAGLVKVRRLNSRQGQTFVRPADVERVAESDQP